MKSVQETHVFVFAAHVPIDSSLKDDDSGDHEQDQGSPKDGEKENMDDEDRELNFSKRKVGLLTLTGVCSQL